MDDRRTRRSLARARADRVRAALAGAVRRRQRWLVPLPAKDSPSPPWLAVRTGGPRPGAYAGGLLAIWRTASIGGAPGTPGGSAYRRSGRRAAATGDPGRVRRS